jgi:hypothetical protein
MLSFTVMKKLCSILLFGFTMISASAEDVAKRRAEETGKKYKEFETVSGQVYRDVTITEITDAGVSITHADGLSRLRFEHLKPEHRKAFGITQDGGAAIYAEEMKAQAAYEAKVEAQLKEQQKAKDELLAKQMAALLEAEKTVKPQKIVTSNIESNVEIPTYPIIRGTDNAVLYGTRRYTPSNTTYYQNGGYVYPGGYGYYPSYQPQYYPHGHCPPAQRGSIFHFTIK